jgi:hydrogenase maturation protease
LGLLDSIKGYDRLILVDAIVTGAMPGTVHQLEGVDVARASHLGPGHDADLPTVLALGQKLAAELMPRDVMVVAVEAADVSTVSVLLTPAVESAVSEAAAIVVQLCV